MNMEHSSVQLIDLPDELLMIIFKKLDNMNLLYSLVGVNMRLNQIISDRVFTGYLILLRWSSDDGIYPLNDAIID
jgi:hypothetical protein